MNRINELQPAFGKLDLIQGESNLVKSSLSATLTRRYSDKLIVPAQNHIPTPKIYISSVHKQIDLLLLVKC